MLLHFCQIKLGAGIFLVYVYKSGTFFIKLCRKIYPTYSKKKNTMKKIFALIVLSLAIVCVSLYAQQQNDNQQPQNAPVDNSMNSLYSQGKVYLKIFQAADVISLEKQINQYAIDTNSFLNRVSIAVKESPQTRFYGAVLFGRE